MLKVSYKEFDVTTDLTLPVTEENYYRHSLKIWPKNDPAIRISREEVFRGQVEGLLSGNEQEAKDALRSIIWNREDNLNNLKKLL